LAAQQVISKIEAAQHIHACACNANCSDCVVIDYAIQANTLPARSRLARDEDCAAIRPHFAMAWYPDNRLIRSEESRCRGITATCKPQVRLRQRGQTRCKPGVGSDVVEFRHGLDEDNLDGVFVDGAVQPAKCLITSAISS